MFYLWLTIVLLLLIAELLTAEFKTIWFVLSALLAMLSTYIFDEFLKQFLVFSVFGLLLLFILRPILVTKKLKNLKNGVEGITVSRVTKNKLGLVKIGNIIYRAKSKNKISEGKKVILTKVLDNIIEVEEKRNN